MNKIIIIFVFFGFLAVSLTCAYDNYFQFDNNQNVVISTIAYDNDGVLCPSCSCNITIFYPFPNESIIYHNSLMTNKGNGVFSSNLSNMLNYSDHIYPLSMVCNDSTYTGIDPRSGIKVSETMFDYTAGLLGVGIVAILLLAMGFKVDNRFPAIKLLAYFSSLGFMFAIIFLSYIIFLKSPNSDDFQIIMAGVVAAFGMVVLAIIFLFFKYKLVHSVEIVSNIGTRRQ